MGIINSIEDNKIRQILDYYCFHKKINYIVKNSSNPLFDHKKQNLFNKVFNPFNEQLEKNLYIIDNTWLGYWKAYTNYEKAKSYFDKIDAINEKQLKKEIKQMCNNMKLTGEINSDGIPPFPMDNEQAGNSFCNRIILNLENLNCLVTENNYNYFIELTKQKWNLKKIKTKEIKGIIIDGIICLIFEEQLKVKFIYNNNNNLIQLTADFSPKEFNILENRNESHDIFTTFIRKKVRRYKFNDWINFFRDQSIEKKPEIQIYDDNIRPIYILRNDNLLLKYLSDNTNINKNINNNNKINNSIIFNNVNKERFIGLENIGATCYMNATLQCFINCDILTRYLLTESIYNNIISKKDICELTSRYCELLMNVCCNMNIKKSYKPKTFKQIISVKNPLFKGINANDSKDLINFMLEEMNNELNLLENKGNIIDNNLNQLDQRNKEIMLNSFIFHYTKINKSIIPRIFYFIIEIQTKCLKCNEIKYNYQVSFMLEFVLSLTYDYCLKNNIPSTDNNGNPYISLLSCFESYKQPSYFSNDNQIYCSNCQTNTNALYSNNIYSLSPIIIITLNRGKGNIFKCDVDFPEILNLQQFVQCPKSSTNYRLKAVITNLGSSRKEEHFIAYCRHRINGNWYCSNLLKFRNLFFKYN